MSIGALRGHPAPRCALEVTLLEQVRLVDVLDRLRVLADRGSKCFEADRTTVELVRYRPEEAAVAVIEAGVVHLERRERLARDREGDVSVVAHLRVIADPFQPAVRDPRCAPGTKGDLARGCG